MRLPRGGDAAPRRPARRILPQPELADLEPGNPPAGRARLRSECAGPGWGRREPGWPRRDGGEVTSGRVLRDAEAFSRVRRPPGAAWARAVWRAHRPGGALRRWAGACGGRRAAVGTASCGSPGLFPLLPRAASGMWS